MCHTAAADAAADDDDVDDWHPAAAEALERGADPHIEAVQQRVRAALGLPDDHRVSFVDLHDAMTSMQTHGKPIPEGGPRGGGGGG